MAHKKNRMARRRKTRQPQNLQLENLEPRLLLSTVILEAGQPSAIFDFEDSNQETVRVTVGSISGQATQDVRAQLVSPNGRGIAGITDLEFDPIPDITTFTGVAGDPETSAFSMLGFGIDSTASGGAVLFSPTVDEEGLPLEDFDPATANVPIVAVDLGLGEAMPGPQTSFQVSNAPNPPEVEIGSRIFDVRAGDFFPDVLDVDNDSDFDEEFLYVAGTADSNVTAGFAPITVLAAIDMETGDTYAVQRLLVFGAVNSIAFAEGITADVNDKVSVEGLDEPVAFKNGDLFMVVDGGEFEGEEFPDQLYALDLGGDGGIGDGMPLFLFPLSIPPAGEDDAGVDYLDATGMDFTPLGNAFAVDAGADQILQIDFGGGRVLLRAEIPAFTAGGETFDDAFSNLQNLAYFDTDPNDGKTEFWAINVSEREEEEGANRLIRIRFTEEIDVFTDIYTLWIEGGSSQDLSDIYVSITTGDREVNDDGGVEFAADPTGGSPTFPQLLSGASTPGGVLGTNRDEDQVTIEDVTYAPPAGSGGVFIGGVDQSALSASDEVLNFQADRGWSAALGAATNDLVTFFSGVGVLNEFEEIAQVTYAEDGGLIPGIFFKTKDGIEVQEATPGTGVEGETTAEFLGTGVAGLFPLAIDSTGAAFGLTNSVSHDAAGEPVVLNYAAANPAALYSIERDVISDDFGLATMIADLVITADSSGLGVELGTTLMDVKAAAFNAADTLFVVGTVDTDPLPFINEDMPSVAPTTVLATVDTTTGAVDVVADFALVSLPTAVESIAFSTAAGTVFVEGGAPIAYDADDLFIVGVNPDTEISTLTGFDLMGAPGVPSLLFSLTTVPNALGNPFNQVNGIAFTDSGDMFGVDGENASVLEIDVSGGFAMKVANIGVHAGGVSGYNKIEGLSFFDTDPTDNRTEFWVLNVETVGQTTNILGEPLENEAVLSNFKLIDDITIEPLDNVTLGRMMIGGTVTGFFGSSSLALNPATFVGSMEAFYAGSLFTDEFNLDGELFHLLVQTDLGASVVGEDGGEGIQNAYVPDPEEFPFAGVFPDDTGDGTQIFIGRNLQNSRIKGTVLAQIAVGGIELDDDFDTRREFPGINSEVEDKPAMDDEFDAGRFGPSLVDNDTVEGAQYLGDLSSVISVSGSLNPEDEDVPDPTDTYAFGAEAGQTISLVVDPPGAGVSFLDPEGIEIGPPGNFGEESPDDPSFTTQRAGMYTVSISAEGTLTYTVELSLFDADDNYALGGLGVNGTISGSTVLVRANDFGLVDATTATDSSFLAGVHPAFPTITLTNSDLKAAHASTFGTWESDVEPGGVVLVAAAQDVGGVRGEGLTAASVVAGQDIHSYFAASNAVGTLIADRHIGEFRVDGSAMTGGRFDAATLFEDLQNGWQGTHLRANFDGIGEPGEITHVFIGTDWNAPRNVGNGGVRFGSSLSAGNGGDVRFVSVEGIMWNVMSNSASGNDHIQIAGSSTIQFTDDSGAEFFVRPRAPEDLTETPIPQSFQGTLGITNTTFTPISDPSAVIDTRGTLEIKFLPIQDSTGVALISVRATEGITVSGKNGSRADIGTLDIVTSDGGSTETNAIVVAGNTEINVMNVMGTNANRVVNRTPGSILSADFNNSALITELSAKGHVGYSEAFTQATHQAISFRNSIPVSATSQRPGVPTVHLAGSVTTLRAGKSFGQTFIEQDITRAIANSDKSISLTEFDGVAGMFVSTGNVDFFDVGDGVEVTEIRGEFLDAGIYVNQVIGTLQIVGTAAKQRDISGFVSGQGGIDLVHVSKGARLFNLFFGTVAETAFKDLFMVTNVPVGRIEVTGTGSEILNTTMFAGNLGILNSRSGATGVTDSRFATETSGNSFVGTINISSGTWDSNTLRFGSNLTRFTASDGGVTGTPDDPSLFDGRARAGSFKASTLEFATFDVPFSITAVSATKGDLLAVEIATGSLDKLTAKRDISLIDVTLTGVLELVKAGRDIAIELLINGPDGVLEKLQAGRDVNGNIEVFGTTGDFIVGRDFNANLTVHAASPAMKNFTVRGKVRGDLNFEGDITNFNVSGDLGEKDADGMVVDTVIVDGTVTNFKANNVNAVVYLLNTVGTVDLKGALNADFTVAANVERSFKIGSGGLGAGVDVLIDGGAKTFELRGGGVDATASITINGHNTSFKLNGDMDGTVALAHTDRFEIRGNQSGTVTIGASKTRSYKVTDTIEEGARIDIASYVGAFRAGVIGNAAGLTNDVLIRFQSSVSRFTALAMFDTIVTAHHDIERGDVRGGGTRSAFIAGYDPGSNLVPEGIGTDAEESQGIGSLGNFNLGATTDMFFAAGAFPASFNPDDMASNTFLGSTTVPVGYSTAGRFSFRGSAINTEIATDSGLMSLRGATPTIIRINDGPQSLADLKADNPGVFTDFTVVNARSQFLEITDPSGDGDSIRITLSGDGRASYDSANNNLLLAETGPRSRPRFRVTQGPVGDRMFHLNAVLTTDDGSLSEFRLPGMLVDGDSIFGGMVPRFATAGIDNAGAEFGGWVRDFRTVDIDGTAPLIDLHNGAGRFQAENLSPAAQLFGESFDRLTFSDDVDGTIFVQGNTVEQFTVKGAFNGIYNDAGDTKRITLKGPAGGAIFLDGGVERFTGDVLESGFVFDAVESVEQFKAGSTTGAEIRSGGDFEKIRFNSDVASSLIAAGVTAAGVDMTHGTLDDALIATAGSVHMTVGGNFSGNDVIGGISPGTDEIFGTPDDLIPNADLFSSPDIAPRAASYVHLTARGRIITNSASDILATGAKPEVTELRRVPFENSLGAVTVDRYVNTFSGPKVIDVQTFGTQSIDIFFNEGFDGGPLDPANLSNSETDAIGLFKWDPLAGAFSQIDLTTATITVDQIGRVATIVPAGGIPSGLYEVRLNSGVTDLAGTVNGVRIGGTPLDGELFGDNVDIERALPTGNNVPGGNLRYPVTVGVGELQPILDVPGDPELNNDDFGVATNITALIPGGIAGEVSIFGEFTDSDTVDIYLLELAQGQRLDVSVLNAAFGSKTVALVGVFQEVEDSVNPGNFIQTALTTTLFSTNDDLDVFDVPSNVQPHYQVQARDAGMGPTTVHYVVVAAEPADPIAGQYQLQLTTTAPEPLDTPPGQNVFLDFDGGFVPFMPFINPDALTDPFDAGEFGANFGVTNADSDMLIDMIVARIEADYGFLSNIHFQNSKDDGEPNFGGELFSTIVIGNTDLSDGILGIAQSVDRGNLVKNDMAVVGTLAYATMEPRLDDVDDKDELANVIANTASHELGHILGLQHITDAPLEPDDQTAIMQSPNIGSTTDHLFGTFPLKSLPVEDTEFPRGSQDAVDYLLTFIG